MKRLFSLLNLVVFTHTLSKPFSKSQFGANLIPDDTYLEIGTTSASETDLSDEETNLLPISDVVIHGTLYADINFDFDHNYKIYMDADALIQVDEGVELKFTNRTIVQGCVDKWTGIEVWLTNVMGIQFHRQRFSKGDQTIYLIVDEIPAGAYYLMLHSATKTSTKILTILK